MCEIKDTTCIQTAKDDKKKNKIGKEDVVAEAATTSSREEGVETQREEREDGDSDSDSEDEERER